ncbi:MAG TPA: hypothetical protein VFS32_05330 [Candidatus Limnocylindrales bacterium]|nr:hypothetical protein [Candidatus Limnocylindrales bacterium]
MSVPRSATLPAATRRWFDRLEPLRESALLLVGLKLALGLLALYAIGAGGVPGPCHYELAWDGWKTFPPLDAHGANFQLVGVWQRWDACWYGKIATWGYEAGENSVSFFPAFPILVFLATPFVGGSVAAAGEIVAAIAYLVAGVVLLHLVAEDFGRGIARRTLLYVSVFPAAFFLFAPFTESLFLAASAGALLAARRRRWWIAGATAVVATLTRTQGVLLALPLAWEALRFVRFELPPGARARLSSLGPAAVAIVVPAIAFGLWLLVAQALSGVSPIESQDLWGGRNFHAPWDVAAASWQWFVDHDDWLQLFNLVALFGSIALVVAGSRLLPLSYTLLALPQLLLPAVRIQPTPLTSTNRYVLVVFPVFVLLAIVGRNRRFDRLWVAASSIGLGVLALEFVRGNFIA